MSASAFEWPVDGTLGRRGIDRSPHGQMSDEQLAMAANILVALRRTRLALAPATCRTIAAMATAIAFPLVTAVPAGEEIR